MAVTFLETLKKLDAEASPGTWNPGGTDDWITIFKDYSAIARIENKVKKTPVTQEDWANSELICLLRNNTQAIIELVEAAEKQNEWQLKHAVYDIYLAEAVHDALSKLKGDV